MVVLAAASIRSALEMVVLAAASIKFTLLRRIACLG
jgi:hypothetical protein